MEEPKERTFTTDEMEFIKKCIKVYWEYHSNRVHPDNQEDWNISQGILNNKTMDDIRYITFSCSESIHLYKKDGGYNPSYPYKSHNGIEEARTHLTNRGVKDIKIVKHYDE